MQDTNLRLKETMVMGLPARSKLSTRAFKGNSLEGTFFFGVPRCQIPAQTEKYYVGVQVIFISRGADLGVNR